MALSIMGSAMARCAAGALAWINAMRVIIVLAVLWIGLQPAGATGALSCSGDDRSLKFFAETALGRRIGAPFLNFRANIEVRMATIPPDFRLLELDGTAVVQSWLDRNELKLDLYRERESGTFGYIELAIQTKSNDEGTYVGSYVLTIHDTDVDLDVAPRTLEAHGDVTCLVE
jgi:hypothetical protein